MSLDFYLGASVDLGGKYPEWFTTFEKNITHNHIPMWRKAGVYDALYNAEGKQASAIIPVLGAGLDDMKQHAEDYKALAPSNGWGTYDGALSFLSEVLEACKEHPKSEIHISK